MAVISRDEVVQGGNRAYLPPGLYRARVINTKFGKSGGGHDMTTLTCEIIDPEAVEVDGKSLQVAGRQFQMWLMHVPGETWGQSRVFEFMDKLKIDHGNQYDDSMHKDYFLGAEFDIVLSSEEDIMRYPKQPGEKEGKPILDGEGKPITNGFRITTQLDNVPSNCRPSRTDVAF